MHQDMSQIGNFVYPQPAKPKELTRRSTTSSVQDIWRRHGWVPPTESQKDFRASLSNTVDRLPLY